MYSVCVCTYTLCVHIGQYNQQQNDLTIYTTCVIPVWITINYFSFILKHILSFLLFAPIQHAAFKRSSLFIYDIYAHMCVLIYRVLYAKLRQFSGWSAHRWRARLAQMKRRTLDYFVLVFFFYKMHGKRCHCHISVHTLYNRTYRVAQQAKKQVIKQRKRTKQTKQVLLITHWVCCVYQLYVYAMYNKKLLFFHWLRFCCVCLDRDSSAQYTRFFFFFYTFLRCTVWKEICFVYDRHVCERPHTGQHYSRNFLRIGAYEFDNNSQLCAARWLNLSSEICFYIYTIFATFLFTLENLSVVKFYMKIIEFFGISSFFESKGSVEAYSLRIPIKFILKFIS